MNAINLFVIFVVGIIAGSFGTLVGGGGLITVPTLIFLGLPPHNAIATNRLGGLGLLIAGWYKFHKKRLIDYKIGLIMGIPTLIGSIVGASLILQISDAILKRAIVAITIAVLIIVLAKPKSGLEKSIRTIKKSEYIIGVVISFFIGIYAGFYGPGFSTFLSYILIVLFGQTFLESAGTWKIPALCFVAVTVVIFAINGLIIYSEALALFLGTFIGSYVAAHYADLIGNVWIKRLFFIIVLIMSAKLVI